MCCYCTSGKYLGDRCCSGARSEFLDQVGQSLRATGVAEDDVEAGCDGKAGKRATDRAGADNAEGSCHDECPFLVVEMEAEVPNGQPERGVLVR
ncbi:hypothetical protein QFZ30_002013 [Arthrobacter pascens]|nr:hypothetical protein [Arthrobacter pascens]